MAEMWAYVSFSNVGIYQSETLSASSNPTGWESGCSCPRCLMEPYPATCFGGYSLSCTVWRASIWKSSALLCNLLTANKDSKVEVLRSEPVLINSATAPSGYGLNSLQVPLLNSPSAAWLVQRPEKCLVQFMGFQHLFAQTHFNRNWRICCPLTFLCDSDFYWLLQSAARVPCSRYILCVLMSGPTLTFDGIWRVRFKSWNKEFCIT